MLFFFFQAEDGIRDLTVTGVQTCALPIYVIVLARGVDKGRGLTAARDYLGCANQPVAAIGDSDRDVPMLAADRKSTRLNSSHSQISYAVFCLKKKTKLSAKTRPHDGDAHS